MYIKAVKRNTNIQCHVKSVSKFLLALQKIGITKNVSHVYNNFLPVNNVYEHALAKGG